MQRNITEIQKNILNRYEKNGRKLPWRDTIDPYAIHISEVMLQQTQVDRVIPYFHRWMEKRTDYASLAQASKNNLLAYRSGLGFNSRALRLQECAKEIEERYKGKIPKERNLLLELPGIGPYTSAAIMAFAWNLAEPVVDTNIRRVLIFLFGLNESISTQDLEDFAFSIIPLKKSRDWHNALMDYGALELTARKTKIKSVSKQSKFEGSDRQVRGRIMKTLVKHEKVNIKSIEEEFPKKKNVDNIIQKMVEDGLVVRKGGSFIINEE